MYEAGDGVEQDFHLAKRFYDQAAEVDTDARSVFVLHYMLYIPSHKYFFLIDFILYLCYSGWFRISMEIDFVTHML
jgi:hypothetical protein